MNKKRILIIDDEYVTKPVDILDLTEKINKSLRLRGMT